VAKSTSKDNPDAVARPHPGKSELKPAVVGSGSGLAKDAGDKDEVHTSEEELGVTQPRTATAPHTKGGAQ